MPLPILIASRYWSKRFKDRKRSDIASVANILGANTRVPEIFVDDASSHQEISPLVPQILVGGEGIAPVFNNPQMATIEVLSTLERQAPPPLDLGGPLNFNDPPSAVGSSSAAQFGDLDPFASTFSLEESPSVLRQRPGKGRTADLSPSGSPTASPSISPVASPRLGPQIGGSRGQSGNDSSPRQREGSEVMPRDVLEVLGSSEWGDQIRSYIESRSGNQSPTNQGGFRSPH